MQGWYFAFVIFTIFWWFIAHKMTFMKYLCNKFILQNREQRASEKKKLIFPLLTAGCDSWRDGKTFPNIKISDHNIFWIFSFWPIVFESATPLKLRKSVISRACTLLRACNQNIFSLWLATYIYWRTRLQGIELLHSFFVVVYFDLMVVCICK